MESSRRGIKILKFFGLIFVLMICFAISGYKIITTYNNGVINSAFSTEECPDSIIVGDGLCLKQQLTLDKEMIRGFTLSFVFGDDTEISGEIIATLYNDKQGIMAQTTINAAGLVNDDYVLVGFDKVIKNCYNQNVTLKLDFKNFQYNEMVVLKAVDSTDNGYMLLNDTLDSRNLMLGVISAGPDGYFWLICVVYSLITITITVIYILLAWGRIASKLKIEHVYLVAAILLGITFSIMIPVMGVPDEGVHLYSSYQLSNELMGIDSDLYSVAVRDDDAQHRFAIMYFDRGYYNYYLDGIFDGVADNSLVSNSNQFGCYAPKFLYIFGALGITLGRLLSLSTVMTYLLGRLFNTLFFALAVFYAIKKIPFGKCLIFVWAMLPIMLQQANSYSYDCMTNALSILVTSLTLYFMYGEKKRKHYEGKFGRIRSYMTFDLVIYVLGILLLIPCKQHAFVPISFLSLMFVVKWARDNKERIKRFKQRINKWIKLAFYVGVLAAVVLCGAFVLIKLKAMLGAPDQVHIVEWAGEPGYTLSYLLANPVQLVSIVCRTAWVLGDAYFTQMFGASLGWLDISIPKMLIWPFVIMMIISAFRREDEEAALTLGNRIYMCMIALLVIGFTAMGMLLNWTPLSYGVIEGMQGRYFLQVMVIFFLCLRTKGACVSKKADKVTMFTAVFMQLFIITAYFTNIA